MTNPVVPGGRDDMIAFYKAHQAAWETHQALIGVTPAAILDFKTKVEAALSGQDAATAARQSSKIATGALNTAAEALRTTGAAMMATIRAFAETTNDPNVLELAEIPAPKPPQPVGPPEQPLITSSSIRSYDGAVMLKWSGSIAGGTSFNISRKLDAGPTTLLANVSGAKNFTDTTIPECTTTALYSVIAVRGGLASQPSDGVTVRFAGEGAGPGLQQQAEAA